LDRTGWRHCRLDHFSSRLRFDCRISPLDIFASRSMRSRSTRTQIVVTAGRRFQARASNIILNGVSAAR
jgi:hypothetical protein